MTNQYLILGLPRSRTKWLSKFLSYKDWYCGHDELLYMRQIEDIQSWLTQNNTGSIETSAAPFWRFALHLKPDLKLVTIRRNPEECARSAVNSGLSDDLALTITYFKYLDRKLDQIEFRTGCRSYQYNDLTNEETCKDLFEYLLPYEHDSERWCKLSNLNIQIDVPALKRYVDGYKPQLMRLQNIVRQKSLARLSQDKHTRSADLNFDFVSFQNLLDTGQVALQEHCSEVDENPDNYLHKNLGLLNRLDELGALQVTVAVSNGKIFGYLISIISESLEIPGNLAACHTAFYGSSDYPGIGLKLQRKALEGLRQKNVTEVIMRAGVRGAADRTASLYKRLGAEPFGTYYRLELEKV